MLSRIEDSLILSIRHEEVDQIQRATAAPSGFTVIIHGASGFGKSSLLRAVASASSYRLTPVIDLASPQNRHLLGFVCALVGVFPLKDSTTFFELAADARRAGSDKKARDAVRVCEMLIASGAPGATVYRFDNIDRAAPSVRKWLFQCVLAKPNMQSICTSSSPEVTFSRAVPIILSAFSPPQLEQLIKSTNCRLNNEVDLMRLSNGHPILTIIALWALSITEEIPVVKAQSLSQLLYGALRSLPDAESRILFCALAAHLRYNADIAADVLNEDVAPKVMDFAHALPFASETKDAIGGYSVHAIALDHIARALKEGDRIIKEMRTRLVRVVYPRLMSAGLSSESLRALDLERLRYTAELQTPEAEGELYGAFRRQTFEGRVIRAAEIAEIVEQSLNVNPQIQSLRLQLLVIESHLLRNDVQNAITYLNKIKPHQIEEHPAESRARYNYLRARCITAPSTPIGSQLFEAPRILERALIDANDAIDPILRHEIQFELGQSLRLIGQNINALASFQEVELHCPVALLRIRAAEEQAQVYRIMNNLPYAEAAINRATSYAMENDYTPTGVGIYYLANIRRDQGRFPAAVALYERAMAILSESGDDYNSCTIRGDFAWLLLLEGNDPKSFLEEYGRMAELFSFNRELSEYWHIHYHLKMDAGESASASNHLESALQLARQFGNMTMHLDCLMHLVQRAVKLGQIGATEPILKEMCDLEERGCGIKVFRGRALIYQADGLISEGRERDATLAYKQGFETVAMYGNSRSNLELLRDLIKPRRVKFMSLMAQYGVDWNWTKDLGAEARTQLLEAIENA